MQVVHLVYRAMEGVERSQAARFRRVGAYPNLTADGHWLFWQSAAAMTATIWGALLLVAWIGRERRRPALARYVPVFGAALLLAGAGFGYWFVYVELGELSPDFAEGGWASTPQNWLEAGVLLALAIPAMGYRLAARSSPKTAIEQAGPRSAALHETQLVALALGLSVVLSVAASVQYMTSIPAMQFFGLTPWNFMAGLPLEIGLYLPIAIAILSVQICWRSVRGVTTPGPMYITVFEPRRFLLACGALVLILALSIPMVFAFGFAYWVGPW
jgi:hypothetical protein